MAGLSKTASTETHNAERAALLDTLLSTNGNAHALLSIEGRLLIANRAFAAAFGLLPDMVEGRTLADLGIPMAIVGQLAAQIRRVAATGTPVIAAGLLPDEEVTLTPARDADGVVTAVAALVSTDAAMAASLIADARAELERVRAGAARFLSTASHDLRQPFQAMHLFHHLLMGRLTDPGTRELGERLGQALTAHEALLNALLEVSSLEAGRFKPQTQRFPIDDTLGRLLQEFAPEAEAKGLRFNVRPAEVEVATDPLLLERLLRPILANALRYTDRGGVLLAARRRGGALCVEVWDTGIGISESDCATVFEDFRQLESATRDGKGGMGLGLGIVRRLSALLGLPVTLRSRPGKGSVFSVSLPLAESAPVAGGAAGTSDRERFLAV